MNSTKRNKFVLSFFSPAQYHKKSLNQTLRNERSPHFLSFRTRLKYKHLNKHADCRVTAGEQWLSSTGYVSKPSLAFTGQKEQIDPFMQVSSNCSWILRTELDGWMYSTPSRSTDLVNLAPLPAGERNSSTVWFPRMEGSLFLTVFSLSCPFPWTKRHAGVERLSSFSKDSFKVLFPVSYSRSAPKSSMHLHLCHPPAGEVTDVLRPDTLHQQANRWQPQKSASRHNCLWFAFNSQIFCPYKLAWFLQADGCVPTSAGRWLTWN